MEQETPAVIFNPNDSEYARGGKKRGGMIGLVMKLSGGRIQSEATANYILLAFALIILTSSLVIFLVSR